MDSEYDSPAFSGWAASMAACFLRSGLARRTTFTEGSAAAAPGAMKTGSTAGCGDSLYDGDMEQRESGEMVGEAAVRRAVGDDQAVAQKDGVFGMSNVIAFAA